MWAEVAVGDPLCRLSSLIGTWHGIMDVHWDDIIWDKLRLPTNYEKWETFDMQFLSKVVPLERRARLCIVLFTQ